MAFLLVNAVYSAIGSISEIQEPVKTFQ